MKVAKYTRDVLALTHTWYVLLKKRVGQQRVRSSCQVRQANPGCMEQLITPQVTRLRKIAASAVNNFNDLSVNQSWIKKFTEKRRYN